MQQVECEAPELGCAEATLPTRCGAPAVGTLLWCNVRTAGSAPLPAQLCTAADRDGSAQGRGSAVHQHTRAKTATADARDASSLATEATAKPAQYHSTVVAEANLGDMPDSPLG